MKLAQLDNATFNPVYGEVDANSEHFKYRTYFLVEDNYDFGGNAATEITGAEATTWIEKLQKVGRTLPSTTPYILGLVSPSITTKDITSINYKTELLSGVRLEPVFTFTNDGLLDKTSYYHEYIDEQSNPQSKLVIEISEVYTTKVADAGLNPAERAIEKRTKTWKWAFEDGILDDINVKVKEKPYKTSAEQRRVGTRRRENIISAFGDNVGMVLVLQGVATSEADANNKLKLLARTFHDTLDTYKIFGDEQVYQDIADDTSIAWLDTVVLSTPLSAPLDIYDGLYDTQLVGMQGKTIRTYAIEKLKGLVK